MTERIHCCIEGCQRTMDNRPGYAEWLCRKHWKSTDELLRTRHRQARRQYRTLRAGRRFGLIKARPVSDHAELRAAIEVLRAAWRAVVEDAVIKAALHAEDAPKRRVAA